MVVRGGLQLGGQRAVRARKSKLPGQRVIRPAAAPPAPVFSLAITRPAIPARHASAKIPLRHRNMSPPKCVNFTVEASSERLSHTS
jgi:hypothetical protein